MGQASSLEENIQEKKENRKNAHFMLVDGMSKIMTGKVKSCVSSDFNIAGLKWNMIIFPEEEHLGLALMINDHRCIGSNWIVKCRFRLAVVNPTILPDMSQVFLGGFDENNRTLGERNFISRNVLKEMFIINDNALFYAEIIGEVQPKFIDVTSIPRTIGTAERIKLTEVAKNNSRFTWKIAQFSSFNAEHHSSHQFTVGPRKWCIQMYPKGTKEGQGNSLSLFLHASDYVTNAPKSRTLAVFKLRVLDQLKRNHHEVDHDVWFHYDSNSTQAFQGDPKFLPLEELHKASRGFLVNDEMYVGVEFLFVTTTESL